MNSLLELPMKAAESFVRISIRLAEAAADVASGWVGARRRARAPRPAPAPPPAPAATAPRASRPPREPRAPRADATAPVSPPVAEPPPPAPEPVAPAPVAPAPAAEPVAPAPEPVAPAPPPEPPIVVPDLTPGQAARIREEQREAEATEDSPGAVVHVDEPWQGYASMNAPEIIDRLRVSDDVVKAVVLLYERSHRSRKTVLRAAGG
jgi:hypothetical protein